MKIKKKNCGVKIQQKMFFFLWRGVGGGGGGVRGSGWM